MSKFSQLLKMVMILNTGVVMKSDELAEILGVSKRMIRKYVTDIKEAGLPIASMPSSKGGYYFTKDIDEENNIFMFNYCSKYNR